MIRAISTLAFLAIVSAAGAESLTLAPKYDAVGANPDGSKYTGAATVQILSDTTFAIQRTINGRVYKGSAMRGNDALAGAYTIDGEPGLVIYKVDGNGLNGLRAIHGEDGNGSERLAPRN